MIYGAADGSTKNIVPVDQRHNYAQELPDVPELKSVKAPTQKPVQAI